MNRKIGLYKKLYTFSIAIVSLFFLSCDFIPGFASRLDTPQKLEVSSVTSESAVVFWSAVKNAVYYDVMWQRKNEEVWQNEITTSTSIQLNDLYYSQEYTVQVAAMPENDSQKYVISEYAKTNFSTLEDIPPQGQLARPNNIQAVFNEDESAITISWDAVTEAVYYDIDIESYETYMPGVVFKTRKTVTASKTQLIYTDKMLGTSIIIKVAARNSDFSDSCRWSKEVCLDKLALTH